MKNLINKKFGKLLVVDRCGNSKDGHVSWLCLCECGNYKSISSQSLIRGSTKSCGCLRLEHIQRSIKNHGLSRTPEYRSWINMIQRCNGVGNERTKEAYFFRGIKVCLNWKGKNGFQNFLSYIGKKPSPFHSIDRIDVNGNYEEGNVRWADAKMQANNRRIKRIENFSDEEMIQEMNRRGFRATKMKKHGKNKAD